MEQDGELVERRLPCPGWHGPFFSGISQGQIKQLGGRIIAGEVAPVFDDFAQTHIQALDRVGGVDDLADRFRIGEERDHLLPIAPP